jgi:hypothetical protein
MGINRILTGGKTMRLSELIQALISNPDDLSTLPQLVARAQEMETQEGQYLERISKLQDINKSYLAQIPIPGEEQEEEEEEEEPTFEDVKEYLVQALGGDN